MCRTSSVKRLVILVQVETAADIDDLQIEIDIYVDLSPRQRALYSGLLANVSVADLLEKAANIGDADSARSLMNLVMQFRKVSFHCLEFTRK